MLRQVLNSFVENIIDKKWVFLDVGCRVNHYISSLISYPYNLALIWPICLNWKHFGGAVLLCFLYFEVIVLVVVFWRVWVDKSTALIANVLLVLI